MKRGLTTKAFYTRELLANEGLPSGAATRGELLLVSCRSGDYLASRVAHEYQKRLAEVEVQRNVALLREVDFQFSDSETCVRLERHVGGCDVFLFQGLLDPTSGRSIDENYVAFLLAADTLKQWGAAHVTAVLPYLAYGRQDKPSRYRREPTTARFMADLGLKAGIDRLVTWHPHCAQLHGFYENTRVDALDAVELFADRFGRFEGRDDVIAVAPDVGASRFVTYAGRALGIPSAIASKVRPRAEEAITTEIIGDFTGKRIAIVLDDMIGTGGTMYSLIRKLVEEKGIEEVYLGASHNLCREPALARLIDLHRDFHLREVLVTNSIPQTQQFAALPFLKVACLSELLSRVINRIHHNRSVSELFL